MKLSRLSPVLSPIGFSANTIALQDRLDVQLSLKKVDCATPKAEVELQVRAKNGLEFNMSHTNYRFEYDTNLVKSPQIVNTDCVLSLF